MGELYIVRHGIAVERGTPGIPDDERPLTPRGEARMREIGDALAELNLPVVRLVTSPLPRARRTAEILADRLPTADGVEIASVLRAESTAGDVAEWLGLQPEAPLMIVGHNPAFEELVSLLLLGAPNALPFALKKGGVVALRRPWAESERHTLEWAATPRLLRKLST